MRDLAQHVCIVQLHHRLHCEIQQHVCWYIYRMSVPLCYSDLRCSRSILAELNLIFVFFLLCKTLFSTFLSACHSSKRTRLTWFLSGVRTGHAFRNGSWRTVSVLRPSSRLKLTHITLLMPMKVLWPISVCSVCFTVECVTVFLSQAWTLSREIGIFLLSFWVKAINI